MLRIAIYARARLLFHAPNVRHHLPDLIFRHANALLCCAVRRHRRSRDSVINGAKYVRI